MNFKTELGGALPALCLLLASCGAKDSGLPELPQHTPLTSAPSENSLSPPPPEVVLNPPPMASEAPIKNTHLEPSKKFLSTAISELPSGTLSLKITADLSDLFKSNDLVLQQGQIISTGAIQYSMLYCSMEIDAETGRLRIGSNVKLTDILMQEQSSGAVKGVVAHFSCTGDLHAIGPTVRLECHKSSFNIRDTYKAENIFVSEISDALGHYAQILANPDDQ